VAAVVSVALVGDGVDAVLDGDEHRLLRELDALLADLEPGVLVTWNGAAFDLPFLATRADRAGIALGLRLRHDPAVLLSRPPLAGHAGAYRGVWGAHRHLDAYRVYRSDVGRVFDVCRRASRHDEASAEEPAGSAIPEPDPQLA
jgi:DNA polymerase elongation subunit (family B)